MKLLVFCHSFEAYLVPDKVIEKAKKFDRQYHYEDGDHSDALQFFEEVRKKYKPILCGHLLTGSVG